MRVSQISHSRDFLYWHDVHGQKTTNRKDRERKAGFKSKVAEKISDICYGGRCGWGDNVEKNIVSLYKTCETMSNFTTRMDMLLSYSVTLAWHEVHSYLYLWMN